MNYTIRPFTETDRSFIFSTWLLGLYHGNDWFGEIDKDVYFKQYQQVIDALLKKSEVRVACLPDEPDVVLGYVAYTGNTLHWVFVKKAWRKLGIATALVPENVQVVSHLTKVGKSLRKPTWSFNPFL